jgi:sugar lactone lactonase YvrE
MVPHLFVLAFVCFHLFIIPVSAGLGDINVLSGQVGGDGDLATHVDLVGVNGCALDSSGNLYIMQNTRLSVVNTSGIIATIAGNGISGYAGDGLCSTSVRFNSPGGISIDSSGNVYIADTNNQAIRKITPSGTISTVVGGNGGIYQLGSFSGDGIPATSANLNFPGGVFFNNGNLYIADTSNNRIRRVNASGVISTFAGTGTASYSGDGGPATSASITFPGDVFVDASGFVFIADTHNHRIRRVSPSGMISTFAGTGIGGFAGDGGPATSAQINYPGSVSGDALGNIYITDTSNSRIRRVSPSGTISTFAGNATQGFLGDGGAATSAELNLPTGVCLKSSSEIFIADNGNSRIRKVNASTGKISTIAGGGSFIGKDVSPLGVAVTPWGISRDVCRGITYFTDSTALPPFYGVRMLDSSGNLKVLAGGGVRGYTGDGGPASSATFANQPRGVFADSSGNVYIADTSNHVIRKVNASGIISTIAGSGTSGFSGDGLSATLAKLWSPQGIFLDSNGDLYIADSGNHAIRKIDASSGNISTFAGNISVYGFSGDGGQATSAKLYAPQGVFVDSAGNLFIADTNNNRIRMVNSSGIIVTIAGNSVSAPSTCSISGILATSAPLYRPSGISGDAYGNLYIADGANYCIRMVNTSGIINTIAGNGTMASPSGDGGPASSAQMGKPYGIFADPSGYVYFTEANAVGTSNGRVRYIQTSVASSSSSCPGSSPSPSSSAGGGSATSTSSASGSLAATSTATPTSSVSPTPTQTLTLTRTATMSSTSSIQPTPSQSSTQGSSATSTAAQTQTPSQSSTQGSSATSTSAQTQTPSQSSTQGSSATSTSAQTQTPSQSSTQGSSATSTSAQTQTPSQSSTQGSSATSTAAQTQTASPSGTQGSSGTGTAAQTQTASPSGTLTPSNTETPSQTPSLSGTQTPSNTGTPSQTPSLSGTQTPSNTGTPSQSPSQTQTSSQSSTQTPSNTGTPSQSPSQTQTSSQSSTQTPSNTGTPSQSPSQTQTPSQSRTVTATNTGTQTPSWTSSQTATNTASQTASQTRTSSNTGTQTASASLTPSGTPASQGLTAGLQGAIAGGVIGGLLILAGVVAAALVLGGALSSKKKKEKASESTEEVKQTNPMRTTSVVV